MHQDFQVRVPGKWILIGEHSVFRGAMAIALPHPEFNLRLTYSEGGEGLQVQPKSSEAVILELMDSLRDRSEEQGLSFPKITGGLQLETSIPIGAGFGSSAALCVALTKWLVETQKLPISEKDQLEFATQLEHRFHGRSSGMDVAVILAAEPISFFMEQGARPLGIKKIPTFRFHDTGLRTRTSECVIRVEKFREENPTLAFQVDESMGAASRIALDGLFQYNAGNLEEGRKQIARAMNQAQECFYAWQLVPGAAKRLQEDLFSQGALAVKITGAGGGGMLVSLWGN